MNCFRISLISILRKIDLILLLPNVDSYYLYHPNSSSLLKNSKVCHLLKGKYIVYLFLSFFCLFAISWDALTAYGGSQARGLIGAVAASLRQSHSNVGSEPCLQPTPQLTATPDPQPTEQGQGLNPQPHGPSRIR